MRRWSLTALLALCAAVAALLAPRLLGSAVPTSPPPAQPLAIPELPTPDTIPEVALPVVFPPPPLTPPAPALPPEPPARPTVPDDFWMNHVDCGMG